MVWIVWVKWILYTFYICLEAFWVDSMVVNNTVCLLRVISVLVVSLNSSKQRWSLNYKQSHVCFRLNVTYVCERLLLLDVSKLRLLVITVGWSVCLVKNVTACGERSRMDRDLLRQCLVHHGETLFNKLKCEQTENPDFQAVVTDLCKATYDGRYGSMSDSRFSSTLYLNLKLFVHVIYHILVTCAFNV